MVYIFRQGVQYQRDEDVENILDGEVNERSPNIFAVFLRSTIASHVEKLSRPLDVNEVSEKQKFKIQHEITLNIN